MSLLNYILRTLYLCTTAEAVVKISIVCYITEAVGVAKHQGESYKTMDVASDKQGCGYMSQFCLGYISLYHKL